MLSTFAKGDLFEEQVFQFLSREIDEGRFFAGLSIAGYSGRDAITPVIEKTISFLTLP
ncbi:hypothetical protein LN426_13290 [Pseudomonas syringae]|uniref:hypothetical protein n=1 Tax=Pseudomonas syringae TaxID=317 RepID=UPI000400D6AF|nr:hypothetical protein [Pseudomonas syringae]MDC6488264.1 hypothetical protein [Pseudomonas syringae]MDC6493928.1 hypothetical protein [Pseudomonas syringae]MDC6498139.1 hypothetical protein [Pseudomonas syringae]MDC6509132.1 hypothetical protein [Pseudomonas syringae]MDC6526045.1 hypothetical protein [Pseudomonas syringae]